MLSFDHLSNWPNGLKHHGRLHESPALCVDVWSLHEYRVLKINWILIKFEYVYSTQKINYMYLSLGHD